MGAASNVPLEVLVERGEFLPDLHARFGFFRVRIPALALQLAAYSYLDNLGIIAAQGSWWQGLPIIGSGYAVFVQVPSACSAK